ncbi:hypothetical protein P3102_07610 [Amycolatopsis sp. QT-25]|uniref:hypothetical protein n=1 Tax=Amycolatopsis sp. QT-25 TaxID=3034022 RepID=UPI0023EBD00C|nr:hypothetical protein [Amycolatopsis sp. QT-25]WET81083.1 hypothetical protein P3102_07610 [Amycolatopsis sp. QT-25]
MLSIVSGLRKLDVDLKPEHRLLGVDFAGASVNRDMEVLDPYGALNSEWAEESRQSLKDGRLARPVRTEDVGEFLKVDGRRYRTKRLKVLEANLTDLHVWFLGSLAPQSVRVSGRTLLASGGADRVVRFWDAGTGAPLGSGMGHTRPVFGVAFCPGPGGRLELARLARTA